MRAREWTREHLLPPYTSSLPDTVFGVPFSESPHYDKPWFQNTVGRVHGWVRGVDDVYYWLHYRFTRRGRHHVVHTGLKPGWCDVDEVMFRACFALLGRYVEDELGRVKGEDRSNSYRGYHLHCEGGSDEAAIDLWLWYSVDLLAAEAEEMKDYTLYSMIHGYDAIENLKDKKLREMIDIRYRAMTTLLDLRRTLWT